MSDYCLPKLAYDLNELEPVISKELLDLHYNKHHANYVKTLNEAVAELKEVLPKKDLVRILQLGQTIAFNGGSHVNHSMYWENLAPVKNEGGKLPPEDSPFHKQIVQDWGSFDGLISYFTAQASSLKGSGWGWLVYDKSVKRTAFMKTLNQDTVEMIKPDKIPLLTIDVWEHAFYVDYKNAKGDYMKNIWKIVNWAKVEERFKKIVH